MNKKSKKEKMIEDHKRRTRFMVLYVRQSIRFVQLEREKQSVSRDIEYLAKRLTQDDWVIANALINSGVSLDEFLSRFDELEKKDYVCPFGGIE